MLVTGIKIDEVGNYIIHGFRRSGTGQHDNDYVKIKKRNNVGKFRLDTENWEKNCPFDESTKKKLKTYILKNKEELREKIRSL